MKVFNDKTGSDAISAKFSCSVGDGSPQGAQKIAPRGHSLGDSPQNPAKRDHLKGLP